MFMNMKFPSLRIGEDGGAFIRFLMCWWVAFQICEELEYSSSNLSL